MAISINKSQGIIDVTDLYFPDKSLSVVGLLPRHYNSAEISAQATKVCSYITEVNLYCWRKFQFIDNTVERNLIDTIKFETVIIFEKTPKQAYLQKNLKFVRSCTLSSTIL